MIYTGDPFHPATVVEWQADWAHAADQLHALHADSQRLIRSLEKMTRDLYHTMRTDTLWAAVAALADELLAHETLEEQQVEDVLKFWLQ